MKQYGICSLSLVPMRHEPKDSSEMVNQLLFGDTFTIDELDRQWRRICTTEDKYVGWIDKKQMWELSASAFYQINNDSSTYTLDVAQTLTWDSDRQQQFIVKGSRLPNFTTNGQFQIGQKRFRYTGKTTCLFTPPPYPIALKLLIDHAKSYLNTPYLWGGRSPFGIDCSGFTQIIFRLIGVKLLRDSRQQVNQGAEVNGLMQSRGGDLVFFSRVGEEKIIHVGLILPNTQQIIHASGKVRIDRLDEKGIFNNDLGTYTHQLRFIRRII